LISSTLDSKFGWKFGGSAEDFAESENFIKKERGFSSDEAVFCGTERRLDEAPQDR